MSVLTTALVTVKKWCTDASEYLTKNGEKPYEYLLILHDEVQGNRGFREFVSAV